MADFSINHLIVMKLHGFMKFRKVIEFMSVESPTFYNGLVPNLKLGEFILCWKVDQPGFMRTQCW